MTNPLYNRRVFVDMDGVLADFNGHHIALYGDDPGLWYIPNWKAVPGFFTSIPPMPDMGELWLYVSKYDPIVLTGLTKEDAARTWGEKREWLDEHLGKDVPMIGCQSKDKNRYARPGDVLIDDRAEFEPLWTKVGGIWITHTSAKNSIEQLKGLGL